MTTLFENIISYMPILLLALLPILVYFWLLGKTNFWPKHKVPEVKCTTLLGNFIDVLFFKRSVAEQFSLLYNCDEARDKPVVGIHLFHKPALLVKDPELIKKILVKDFNCFSNRHTHSDVHSDVLGANNLFLVRNPVWKQMRSRLTPIFSSGRMKQMFTLMVQIGQDLGKMMNNLDYNSETKKAQIEFREISALYSTDVIGSCAFGVNALSLTNPEAEFRKQGRKIFSFSTYRALEFSSMFFLPGIVPFLKFKLFSTDASDFIRTSINHVMGEREKNGIKRNDLIDTLISLKQEDHLKKATDTNEIVFQGDMLVAQAAVFFTAGFETTSTTMSFGLYELAKQPELLKRLKTEIKDVLKKHNNELTYENITEMKYLNMVVSEILRLYPPLPFLDRLCEPINGENGYPIDYFNFTIPKNMPVMIPVFSIQRDPKYFPNPELFDPERFSPENIHNINPYTYMPFGTGPHNCIGERFGLLQTKIGLINVLKNHSVEVCDKTPNKMVLHKKALLLQSEVGVYLNVVKDDE